jgi:polysaccharide biosynthesis transport protein
MDSLVGAGGALPGISSDSWPRFAKPRSSRPFGAASIRRHKKAVVLSVALCLSLGLFHISSRPVTYTASTELLVYDRQITAGPDAAILPGSVDIPLVYNQIEILRSRAVLAKVIDALRLADDPEYASLTPGLVQRLKSLMSLQSAPVVDQKTLTFVATLASLRRTVSLRRIGTSHVVQASVRASRPEKAASVANKLAQVYLQERMRIIDETPQIREAYQGLGPSAYVISAAEPPIRPDGLSAAMIVLVAVLLGFGVGAIIALLVDVLDNTIRTPEQAESCLGLECLGVIPLITGDKLGWNRKNEDPVDVDDANDGIPRPVMHQDLDLSHALRRVMAEIRGPRLHDFRSLAVTSTIPDEGATTVAVNVARMLARAGEKVTLITDGHVSLGSYENSHTLNSFLGIDIVSDGSSGLHVVPFRELRRTDGSLVGWRLGEVVRKASASCDIVIVDMPPLASGADVRAAGSMFDGILLVAGWGATDSGLVRQAFGSTGAARTKFIGAVLNMVDQQTVERYGDDLASAGPLGAAGTAAETGARVC